MRRISDTEVRQLSNLVMRVEPGALLGDLDKQHNVFKQYWPNASAHTFQFSPPPLAPSAEKKQESAVAA